MPLLLLVDGSSYLYRAFHAMPDLRNKAGEPTGAIYGVLNMLRRLESDYKADYKAVVFDAKGKTFRDDWYPEYKAHRPPMPDEMIGQIEPLHAAIQAAGWPLLMVDGVEADDVIGTLATKAAADGIETLISTGDKDLTQLVSPLVRWYNTMSNELLDEAGVEAKFGVPPGRIVDYLALVGDTVDGVPGVAKCGPKTALKWLAQYGSLDAIVAHADEIGGVVGQNLRAHLAFLPLGKKLVTVACDLSNLPAPNALTTTPRDSETLRRLYSRYEFRSWLRDLDAPAASTAPSEDGNRPAPIEQEPAGVIPVAYETVFTWAQLDAWLARIEAAELTALDTETTSLDSFAARIVGISLSVKVGEACYIPLAHTAPGAPDQLPRDEVLAKLKPWLEASSHKKVLQNAKYDQHVFANHGIALAGIEHDTMLQSYVIESDKGHDLGQLCSRHLGLATIAYEDLCGKGAKQIGFDQVDIERAATYSAEDSDVTLRVHQALHPRFAAEPGLSYIYHAIEMPARQVIWRIERNGILIDSAVLARQSHEMGQKIMALEAQAFELAGQPFNLASPKQLAEILFEKLGLPVKKKTPSGGPSTDEEVLSELALDYPLPKLLLEHRSLSKLKGTYTDKLPRMVNPATGRVHTHFAQAAVVTGRLASSDPNLQNIPVRSEEGRKIRTAFIAPAGSSIVSADYSQIELRIMAHLSGDPGLLDAFAHGEDVHRATAGEIFGVTPLEVGPDQRRVAKSINFGLIYGMSAFGLARQLGLERSAAQIYIDRYFARYTGVAQYMEEARETARQKGYVETAFGRRLWFPDIRSSNGNRRQGAERAAINAPMQGTAADLIKLAMIAVQNWLEESGRKSRLVLQVHDELVLEVPDDELNEVRMHLPRLMGQVAELKVPLVVELGVGPNWEAAH
ncbi:DNA polymerase I [Dechloromonas denitrificans]|uniref:DNA polymerase I n=1 Tax=Dechloromonas denitrificans TaxID=281362 RepID=UPI001CF8F434|nr:DNA polymerase I [Dechloromonas denitrificans]UCV03840.1 DNA polymerase I [Dechloromonas denitrificans]UCV08103.1 DNA polymerase I [Dechloromonas denitrificans]